MILFRLFIVFMKIGVFTFGSGYAMLALAEKEVVELNKWLTPEQFSNAMALSEVTPGPIMVNLATFVGVKIQGIPGAVIATLGLILPPMIFLIVITKFYIVYKDNEWVQKAFKGLRPAVIGLIITIVIKLSGTTLVDYKSVLITLVVVVGVFSGLHPIFAIVGASLLGFVLW